MSVKKNKKDKPLLSKQVFIIGIIIILVIGLIKFFEFRQKHQEVEITAEGVVETTIAACPGSRNSIFDRIAQLTGNFTGQKTTVVVRVFLSPKLYYLSENINKMKPIKYISHFDGKRIRVVGTSDGTLRSICLNGKEKEIPLLKVTDFEPLE